MRLINISALIKNLLISFSCPKDAPLSEAERLLAEIEETREKMEYAWHRLDYAASDYVEIAVLELLIIETQFGLLNKRYRLLLGIKDEASSLLPSSARALSSSMASRGQNHAYYKSLLNSTPEPSPFPDSISHH